MAEWVEVEARLWRAPVVCSQKTRRTRGVGSRRVLAGDPVGKNKAVVTTTCSAEPGKLCGHYPLVGHELDAIFQNVVDKKR